MSFLTYDEYKESSYQWVGTAVPKHWQVRRLKSLVAEPLKYGANESAEDEDRSQPRFVRITDINDDGGLRDETFKSLPAEIAEPYLLYEGDVLLARSGATVGKSFIYSEEWGTACFAGYLIRARLRPSECLPTWLSYFCQTDGYWGYVAGSQIQATIQNVSAEKYANLYFAAAPARRAKGDLVVPRCGNVEDRRFGVGAASFDRVAEGKASGGHQSRGHQRPEPERPHETLRHPMARRCPSALEFSKGKEALHNQKKNSWRNWL